MLFTTNIDSKTLPETQQQLINEILKFLTMPGPYVFPAYIGLPPYHETKNDLLYQILMILSGGGGSGGGGGAFNVLQVRTTDPINKTYPLPAKCLVLFVVLKFIENTDYEIIAGDGTHPNKILVPLQSYIANEPQSSAPTIYIEWASEIKLQASGLADGISADIFYTTSTI